MDATFFPIATGPATSSGSGAGEALQPDLYLENQFRSSVKVGGSGCWFTFGRAYFWPVIMPTAPVVVPPAYTAALGGHRPLVSPHAITKRSS
jgi:hypothetical protein